MAEAIHRKALESSEVTRGAARAERLPAIHRAAWTPVLVVVAAAAAALVLDHGQVLEPAWLLAVLNAIFLSAISLLVASLAAHCYLAGGSLRALLVGAGVLTLGLGSYLTSVLLERNGPNAAFTLYGLVALIAGALHLAAAGTSTVLARPESPRARPRHAAMAYAAVILSLLLLTVVARRGALPPFFLLGEGPTALRQIILGFAALELSLAAVLIWEAYHTLGQLLLRWYALGLILLALGLGMLMLPNQIGSPLNWVGRGAQYAGSLYLLIAIGSALRESRQPHLPLVQALAVSLLETEVQFKTFMDSASEAVLAVEVDGRIRYWNQTAERMFGYSRTEAFGADLVDLLVLRLQADAARSAVRQAATGAGGPLEVRVRDRTGDVFWAELAFYGAQRLPRHFTICTITDITQRKQLEEDLRRATQELEGRAQERAREMSALREALQASHQHVEAALADKAVLLQEARHRIEHSLQLLSNLLILKADALHGTEARSALWQSAERAHYMARLHCRLYESVTDGGIRMSTYLHGLAHEIEEGFGVPILVEVLQDDLSLETDHAIHCGLIVNELLLNAAMHAFPDGQNGEIGVGLHANEGRAVLRVWDRGRGGLSATIHLERGPSIGLRLVGILAQRLHADLTVDRTAGTAYTLTFPVVEEH